jgi:hypothetical protein
MPNNPERSPDEIHRLLQDQATSDSKKIREGAQYVDEPAGRERFYPWRLEFTKEQVEAAAEEGPESEEKPEPAAEKISGDTDIESDVEKPPES